LKLLCPADKYCSEEDREREKDRTQAEIVFHFFKTLGVSRLTLVPGEFIVSEQYSVFKHPCIPENILHLTIDCTKDNCGIVISILKGVQNTIVKLTIRGQINESTEFKMRWIECFKDLKKLSHFKLMR
jgi:hypothetical protein